MTSHRFFMSLFDCKQDICETNQSSDAVDDNGSDSSEFSQLSQLSHSIGVFFEK